MPTTIYVPGDVQDKLRHECARGGVAIADALRDLVRRHLEEAVIAATPTTRGGSLYVPADVLADLDAACSRVGAPRAQVLRALLPHLPASVNRLVRAREAHADMLR
jgi:hypothetical protein